MIEQPKENLPGTFLELARQPKTFTIWMYCDVCWQRQEFKFLYDRGLDEIYTCCKCGHIHSVRVR